MGQCFGEQLVFSEQSIAHREQSQHTRSLVSYDSSVKLHWAPENGGCSRVAAAGSGLVEVVQLVVLVLELRWRLGQHVGGRETLPVDAVVCAEVDHQIRPAGLDRVRRLKQARLTGVNS